MKLPWLVGPVRWSQKETRRAVCWLSNSLKRPVLKLTDEDYNEHGLSDLLSEQGPAYQLNIRIFNQLQQTISGWPGGKPNADDTFRPERANPYPKRALVLSPEPQDATVSLGSTLDRLREQGHEVKLVSMTSGSLRVSDAEADKFASILLELGTTAPASWKEQTEYAQQILSLLESKGAFGEDPPELRKLKALILRGELRDAAQALGLPQDRITFLDLPFYEWEIDMAMPISPMQLELKARALTRYTSLTSLELEATKTNQGTAQAYDSLGLANYEAIESFQRWQKP